MAFSDALKSLESWRGIKHHITYFSKALSLVVVENLDPGGTRLHAGRSEMQYWIIQVRKGKGL